MAATSPRLIRFMRASPWDPITRLLGHEDFDAPVTLPARLVLVGALGPLLAEVPCRDAIGGHAFLDQRIAHGAHPALAEREVVLARAARIRIAVDAQVDRRIALQVLGDVRDLPGLARPDVR